VKFHHYRGRYLSTRLSHQSELGDRGGFAPKVAIDCEKPRAANAGAWWLTAPCLTWLVAVLLVRTQFLPLSGDFHLLGSNPG
jgi:hypothetical protein